MNQVVVLQNGQGLIYGGSYLLKKDGNRHKVMKKKLDTKMWYLYNQCFDCQVTEENKLRIAGIYDEWEQEKLTKNKLAWITDRKQEILEFKEQKTPTFYNQVRPDGYSIDTESWKMDTTHIKKLANEALEHLEKIEESLK